MGRRTFGLLLVTGGFLLVTGIVAAGAVHSGSVAEGSRTDSKFDAEGREAGVQDAGFRVFASRSFGAAIVPAGHAPSLVEPAHAKPTPVDPASGDPASGDPAARSPAAPALSPVQSAQLSPAAKPAATIAPPGPGPAAAAATIQQPALIPAPSASWPKTLPEAKAEAEARANPQAAAQSWPQAEIDLAMARCTAILKGIDAVTVPEPPMREGDCGAPAPVRLVSIGRNPEVALSPPPVVTCDMVVAMHTWVKSDLQPLAKKHLGAPVIKIETMSDYSCRNAYGRTKSRLSEHGKANALDIRGFVTAKAEPAMLLADWGLTARDIAAQVAAAKAEAQKQLAERAQREKVAAEAAAVAARAKGHSPAPASAEGSATAAAPAGTGPAIGLRDGGQTLTEGMPRVRITIPGTARDDDKPRSGPAFGVEPNRLGGPMPPASMPALPPIAAPVKAEKEPVTVGKPQQSGKLGQPATTAVQAPAVVQPPAKGRVQITHAPASSRDQASSKARFLREAHAAGCRIFGTILGPEANNAHRNHFHVDMAERKTTNFCE